MNRAFWIILIVLLLVGLVLPVLPMNDYIMYLIILVMLHSILAVSMNLLIGYTGLFTLAHAAFYGLGAYISALLTMKGGLPFWESLIPMLLIVAFMALIIGYPSLRFTSGIYFALVTFGFGELIRLIVANWYDVTGGSQGLRINYVPFGSREGYYYTILIILVGTMLGVRWFLRTKIGRGCLAIREDETLAESLGINLLKYKLITFILGSCIAALAGAFYAPFMRFINPDMLNVNMSVNLIGAIFLGGIGTTFGPLVGSIIFVALPEVLRVAGTWRLVILGATIVVTVMLMKKGIVGSFSKGSPIMIISKKEMVRGTKKQVAKKQTVEQSLPPIE